MSRFIRAKLAAGAAAVSLLALSGCAAGAGGVPTPTVTTTVTSTVTATPAPAASAPDDPIDAMTAWTACAVLAQEAYVSQAPTAKQSAFEPSRDLPTKNGDGSWRATVGFSIDPPTEGAGGVIVSCDIAGTMASPKLVHWTIKDI